MNVEDPDQYLSEEVQVEADSDDSETFKEMLNIHNKHSKNKKAHRTKLPPDIAAVMGEANQHFMFSRFDEAQMKAQEIINKYPDYSEPFYLLGLIEEEKKEKKKAAKFFTLAAQLSQSDSKLWSRIGYLHKESRCYEQASESFGRALKSDPSNKILMIERAECFEYSGELRKAIQVIEKFIQPSHEYAPLIIKCAKLYSKISQPNKAIEHLSKIIKTKDGSLDLDIVNRICELYIWERNYQNCLEFLNNILEIDSQSQDKLNRIKEVLADSEPDIVAKYGICCGKLGMKAEANISFQVLRDVEDYAEYSDLFIKAAEIYHEMKEYENAIELYEQLINLEKFKDTNTHLDIWINLSELYCENGKHDEAIKLLNKILEMDPDNYQIKINLSKIYMTIGRREEALGILNTNNYEPQDENVFLSDDEQGEQIENIDARRFIRKAVTFLEDRPTKVIKVEDDLYKPVRIKPEREGLKTMKLTKESINTKLSEIHKKYPINFLILKFDQARFFLEDGKEKQFLNTIVDPLILSLNLEIAVKELRKKVFNRFLVESQKKNFKKKVESGLEFESREIEQNVLLKTKKSKIPNEMLQKKKTKYSKYLTERQFENAQIMSKKWGSKKIDYYNISGKTLTILEKHEEYEKMAIICELLIKLKTEYENESETLLNDVHIFGFMSNYFLHDFEKAFYYIRSFCKDHAKDNFAHTLLALCLQRIEDPAVYRMYMSKVQIRNLDEECEAIKQILGNNYLQTGFYELSVNTYMKLHEVDPENPLINLLLGLAFLQGFSSRTTTNKPQMLIRAFQCLEKYQETRGETHVCETYYNMGRAYAQVSMLKEAIQFFEKSMSAYLDRVSTWRETFKDEKKVPKLDNLFHQTVYNLVIIHKHLGNHEIVKQLINDFMYIE